MKTISFWKSHWGKHFKIAIGVYILFSIIFAFLTISLFCLPIDLSIMFSLPWIILYSNVIFIGIIILFATYKSIKPFFLILDLNDCHYRDRILKTKIPLLVIVLPLYLIIFYVYFNGFNVYEPVGTLFLSWIVLIIVRSSHYVDRKLGNRLGGFIGAFFLPFGFITLAVNINEFFRNTPNNLTPIVIFIFYFFLILIAQVSLEILMDYISTEEKEKELKSNWLDDPNFRIINDERVK
ncbi:hypothetical protein MBGDF03_00152 [Thermoplasmatales archaeon SCGC AB-540-F20]|nr:hypothetical protein MBGDF03_00152 [Thermoplasmatales archaeon SCGC AB-540-F20]